MTTIPTQPPAHDRDELARLLPELVDRDLPGDRQRQLQEFVMSHIHQDLRAADPVPPKRSGRRLVLATSALAAVAVAVVAVSNGGFDVGATQGNVQAGVGPTGSAAPELSPVAQTFELAAAYAAAAPFVAPRPNQWIYVENRILSSGAIARDKGQARAKTDKVWRRADGTKMAAFNPESGRFETWSQDNGYPTLSALPTDPRELLATLRTQMENPTTDTGIRVPARGVIARTPEEWNMVLFRRIAGILSDQYLPPAVTAALWRAAALIPGVTRSAGTITVDGRTVIAVGRIQEGWQFEQLLLDPDTHEFVGYRAEAVKDTTVAGSRGPIPVRKGDVQFSIARIAAKIVNAAGQTR